MTGGTFLLFQYNEMLFHVIGLSIGLRSVALRDEHPGPASEPQLPALALPGGGGA